MKILLINNDSDSWQELQSAVSACGFEVTAIHHSEIIEYVPSAYDAAILSGGWLYDDPTEMLENYGDELQLIRVSPIPILGICIGMHLMHIALDQSVPLLAEPQNGFKTITVNQAGQQYFGFPAEIEVYKNHTNGVIETDPEFEILAYSPGHTEIMKHRTRPLVGVQFHPEMGETDDTVALFLKLLAPLGIRP